jgi:hypothetical protein
LVVSQVLQNAPHFAVYSGSCSETEVSEQLYYINKRQWAASLQEARSGLREASRRLIYPRQINTISIMDKLKSSQGLHFVQLPVLLTGVLFSALAEFTGNIKYVDSSGISVILTVKDFFSYL